MKTNINALEALSANYLSVEPDSHYWITVEMLQNWLLYAEIKLTKEEIIKELKIGLNNTLKQGYNLQKSNDTIEFRQ